MSAASPATATLDRVRVVLCRTSLPANIGACARAMKTMGLTALCLVDAKHFPHPDAEALASGAADVLAGARVCANLDEALAGTVYAAASTARRREMSHPVLTPREMAACMVEQAARGPVALVMGPEKSGLTVREVDRCSVITTIPANPAYSSLNLAAAVQLLAYEIRLAAETVERMAQHEFEAATYEEIEMFYDHLERALLEIGFLDPKAPRRLMQRMRRLFARARLEREEVNLLRGILNMAQEHARGARALPPPKVD
jgi:tRNA/rRNA methyltransferase